MAARKARKPKVERTVHQQISEIEHKERQRRGKISLVFAVIALLLNILIVPGIGSVIAGRIRSGIIQILLAVIGFFLWLTVMGNIAGIFMLIVAWVWALITGINIVKDSD